MMVYKLVAVIWTIYLISIVRCIQFIENSKENDKIEYNMTTLYPVDKISFITSTEHNNLVKISEKDVKKDRTSWNINTSFAEPKHHEDIKTHLPQTSELDAKDCKHLNKDDNNDKGLKTTLIIAKDNSDNIDDIVNPEKEKEVTKNHKENKEVKNVKEFKPSPHLNSYYDTIDESPLNTFTTSTPIQNTPTFFGSPRDKFKPHNNQEGYVAFPYKYETYSAVDSSVWGGQSLQSKPTIEAPVRIPAGGLYKLPDVLREKPNSYEDNDYPQDSGNHVKENSLKKRVNPWKSLLHLVTALLPIGLIVSALTPSIITIEDSHQFNRASRRLGEHQQSPTVPALPAVSEDCKRRLLCEIHSDRYYDSSRGGRRAKPCHKLRCEEPRALSDLLHWLLAYHRSPHTRHRGQT